MRPFSNIIFLFEIPGSPWSCLCCGKTVGVSTIHSIVNAAVKIIGTKRDESNEVLLETIEILEQALHQNHYLILGLKEIIIQRLMTNIRKKTGIYEFRFEIIFVWFSLYSTYKLFEKAIHIDFRKSYWILQPQDETVWAFCSGSSHGRLWRDWLAEQTAECEGWRTATQQISAVKLKNLRKMCSYPNPYWHFPFNSSLYNVHT